VTKTDLSAFLVPQDDHWQMWAQSPNGSLMPIAGRWETEHEARGVVRLFGYQLMDSAAGIALLEQQMHERADLGPWSRTVNRGRKPCLTAAQIAEIRDMYAGPWTVRQIAGFFKVSSAVIHAVLNRTGAYRDV
jgi:hypothetical protein